MYNNPVSVCWITQAHLHTSLTVLCNSACCPGKLVILLSFKWKGGLLFPELLALLYLLSPKLQKPGKRNYLWGGSTNWEGEDPLLSQGRWCVYADSCMSGTWGCSSWCAWEGRNWRAGCRRCWQTGHRSHLRTLRPRWGCRGCWSGSWSEGYLIR